MPFTLDRESLNIFGDLSIDAVIAISRLVNKVNAETAPDVITAVRAVIRVYSLVIKGRMDKESAVKMIGEIGMRFVDRPVSEPEPSE